VTAAPVALRAGTWTVVPERTRARFTVRKLGLIRVRGSFAVPDGSAVLDRDGVPVAAAATLDAASFRTGLARRDADITGPRFLDAARSPLIHYRADRIEPAGSDGWLVRGTLTVRGRDAPLDLAVTVVVDGGDRARLSGRGVLDRATTGLPGPRWLIGRRVEVDVEAELTR
jgi:polyisoprenoid-binding protein YceI